MAAAAAAERAVGGGCLAPIAAATHALAATVYGPWGRARQAPTTCRTERPALLGASEHSLMAADPRGTELGACR